MAWKYDEENHRAFDAEADLMLVKQGFGRDNFEYLILKLSDRSFCFSFEAAPKGETRELDEKEKNEFPSFDEITSWSVAHKNQSSDQQKIILEALIAITNSRGGGYCRYVDGIGRRSMVKINYVNRMEGR